MLRTITVVLVSVPSLILSISKVKLFAAPEELEEDAKEEDVEEEDEEGVDNDEEEEEAKEEGNELEEVDEKVLWFPLIPSLDFPPPMLEPTPIPRVVVIVDWYPPL
jgi:hypothetical protein